MNDCFSFFLIMDLCDLMCLCKIRSVCLIVTIVLVIWNSDNEAHKVLIITVDYSLKVKV